MVPLHGHGYRLGETDVFVKKRPEQKQEIPDSVAGEGLSEGWLIVRDISGRIHLEKKAGASAVFLDVRGLAPGIYHILLESDDHTSSYKFIKK